MTTAERRNTLLVTAIVLSAFNLRTAVTSVGARRPSSLENRSHDAR